MRHPLRACCWVSFFFAACGGESENLITRAPHAATPHAVQRESSGAPRLPASPIARIPSGTFGPYLGMSAQGGVTLWASAASGSRGWFARAVSATGVLLGDTQELGEAPNQLGLVSVRPIHDAFVRLSTHKTNDGEAVELAFLSATGALLAGPTSLGRTPKSVLWVEAIPSTQGATVLWAESGAGRAQIWSVEATKQAELSGTPRLLARDAGAWQAVAFGSGLALAVTHVGKANMHGPIELTMLNEGSAGAASPDLPRPITINQEISADLDLDMAAVGTHLVLAWSDHRGGENRVFSAVVDEHGKILSSAAPATPPLGEQAVLRVVPPVEGNGRAYLAWEALDAQVANYRGFQVAELGENGRVTSVRGQFEYWKMDGSMPEIAATPNGVAVLTLAPICPRTGECSPHSPTLPEFVEFDSSFVPRTAEPLWPTREDAPASLAWNLTCPKRACFALSAESGTPSQVSLTRLEHVSDLYRAPAQRVELPPRPRVIADQALADTEPLSQITLTETSAGTLLAWLTDFDPTTPWVKLKKPTSDGRYEPLRARLDVQGFNNAEPIAALGAPETLSVRAHSLGGVALSGSAARANALAAWAGLDGGTPQVFLTLLDNNGKKLSQRMLTHKNGELSDVSIVQSGTDYLVAWIDERSSDPELYATKVNSVLTRIALEQRLTQAPGAATDLSLVGTKTGALAVWADARESELPGAADIYATTIRGSDAARAGNELCLQKSRAHSFAPMARAYGTGALVAWLDAASDNPSGEPAHLNLAVLDEAGHLVGAVQSVAIPGATPVTLGLDCVEQVCHAVVAVDEATRGALYAITIRDGKNASPVRIRASNSAPSSVAPVVHGSDVFISEIQQGRARLRRLRLEW